MNLQDVSITDLALVLMRKLQSQEGINEVNKEVLHNIVSACEAEILNRTMDQLPFLTHETEMAVYCYD